MNNKKSIILLIITILIVIVATFSVTYAYLSVSSVQENPNSLTTGSHNVTISENNQINLVSYPMSDTKGLQSTPYTFTINNTGTLASSYELILNVKNTSSEIVPYMNYSLDGSSSVLLSNTSKIELPTGATKTGYTSYIIDIGSISASQSKTYNLRLWIASYAGNDVMGKRFEAEIMVYAVPSEAEFMTKKYTLTNLVSDASFEENNGWTGGAISTDHVKYGNRAFKLTGTSSVNEVTSNSNTTIALNKDHVYYARYEIYHTGATGTVGLYWPPTEPNFFENQALGTANKWNMISAVNNRSSFTNSNQILRLDYNNVKATTSVWYDGVMLIDLTESFGSGKEPDKAWCDTNIPFFTGQKKIVEIKEKGPMTISDILAGLTISTRTDFSTVLTTNTTGKIYTAEDDDGTSYYFAGAVDNNWVKFGGFYWRIIRINGDGTLRLIYNGTTTDQTGTSTQIGTAKYSHKDAYYNSSTDNAYVKDNAYVGYMYGATGASTYAATHTNTNSSNIKETVDSWYNTNLNKAGIKEYIDTNAGFCGDRTSNTSNSAAPNGTGGYGKTVTYYGSYYRNITNKTPSLKCTNTNDLYTVSNSNKGNKALTYPVGLITIDEVAYAGGKNGSSNQSYYLYNGQNYWTMSPFSFGGNGANVFYVNSSGFLFSIDVDYAYGVRPVVNLKADTLFTKGDGSKTSPFEIA